MTAVSKKNKNMHTAAALPKSMPPLFMEHYLLSLWHLQRRGARTDGPLPWEICAAGMRTNSSASSPLPTPFCKRTKRCWGRGVTQLLAMSFVWAVTGLRAAPLRPLFYNSRHWRGRRRSDQTARHPGRETLRRSVSEDTRSSKCCSCRRYLGHDIIVQDGHFKSFYPVSVVPERSKYRPERFYRSL